MDGFVSHLLIISIASPLLNLLLSKVHLVRLRECVEHLLLGIALHCICCIGLSSPHRLVRVRVREFITLGGFGLLDGFVIFIVKIVKRPMWPRFPQKLPFVVCSVEGC